MALFRCLAKRDVGSDSSIVRLSAGPRPRHHLKVVAVVKVAVDLVQLLKAKPERFQD